ncbi:hypothetical protein U7230_15130 [Carboxydochorda subterranea]|uniref:Pyruvate carboxyltransferase domain-containing protein n=1 Tax=Carboxydichorda subterranea TaxID=3109565 RepID=A0ABZ1BXI8_9FIRM|nr:hypothetical protein [Limnochorda sp. L945t]WRP17391.1 hypothetical protein U7230_15130 [Limnochorda sp. L945t]
MSPLNYRDEVREAWTVPQRVEIHDVTLRDGEQTPRVAFTPQEKVFLAQELDALGVASIEPGLLATPEDREVVATLVKMGLRARIKPLVRVREEDVAHAIELRVPAMVLEFGINPYLVKYAYNTTPERLTDQIIEFSNAAKKVGMEVEFMGWDAFRIPDMQYLQRFFGTILEKGSIDRITVSDTFGMAHPDSVRLMFHRLRAWFPEVALGLHIHNDYGLATANALMALTSGATSVHSSVNGLGERAGNVATEEVAVALQHLLGIDAGIKLERLYHVSRLVTEISKKPVAQNKPIVGPGLFEVESGIVVHVLRQFQKTPLGSLGLLPYLPETVGQAGPTVVAGRGTGRNAVQMLLEAIGMTATDEQVAAITERVKQTGLVLKNALPEQVFRQIVDDVLGRNEAARSPTV